MDSIASAVYNIPDIGKVTFKDGAFDEKSGDSLGESGAHIGLIDLYAFGDLNGDGAEDAVTFLSVNYGGSGIFLSLEVLLNKNGSASHTASYPLGDRIGIDSVKIERGVIDLHIITQAPDDPMCCPTLHVSKMLKLENGELIKVNNS